jgi:hypothetical protein
MPTPSLLLCVTCLLAWFGSTSLVPAFELITSDEAKRPDDARKHSLLAGPLAKPAIRLHGLTKTTTSPFTFTIELRPYAGAKINLNTLQVRYLKQPQVDLLPRIQKFIDDSAQTIVIKVPDAEAPPGRHRILLQVEDSNELLSREVHEFLVVQPN